MMFMTPVSLGPALGVNCLTTFPRIKTSGEHFWVDLYADMGAGQNSVTRIKQILLKFAAGLHRYVTPGRLLTTPRSS